MLALCSMRSFGFHHGTVDASPFILRVGSRGRGAGQSKVAEVLTTGLSMKGPLGAAGLQEALTGLLAREKKHRWVLGYLALWTKGTCSKIQIWRARCVQRHEPLGAWNTPAGTRT